MKQEQEKIVPYEALESLGINKKDLKPSDSNALLAGRKTDLMKFTVTDTPERRNILEREKVAYTANNGNLNFEGKVQLQNYMTVDNTEENKNILKRSNIDFEELKGNKLKFDTNVMRKIAIGIAVIISPVTALALVLVPKRKEIKNDVGLSNKQIKELKAGGLVSRANEKNERILTQLDKDTNNLVSVRSKDISIPNKVAGQELTPIQREQLKNGQEIQIKDSQGQSVFAKLDLNEKTGLSLKDENGQKINYEMMKQSREAYDIHNPHIVATVQTDQNSFEYTQYLKERDIINNIKNEGWRAVDMYKDKKEIEPILARYGLEKAFNETHTALEEFRKTPDFSGESDKILDNADKRMKLEAGIALVKLDERLEYKNTVQDISNSEKNAVGKLHFYGGGDFVETVEYTNDKDYLTALKKEIDYNMGGFKYETLSNNPELRKSVDDIIYGAYGEDNPNSLNHYKEQMLPTDKERLQHIANNGLEGIKDIHPTNTKLRDEFLDKHNLSQDVMRADEISKLSPEEYNKQGKGFNKELDGINNSLKSAASSELNSPARENTVKAEPKQETGMKMKF